MTQLTAPAITIRPAYADDERALRRLAALDSAAVPSHPLLVAEIDGDIRAASSLADGGVIANPFFRTADVVELLHVHAAAVKSRRPRSRSAPRRTHLPVSPAPAA